MDEPQPTYIRKERSMRLEGDCAPTIALGFEDNRGEQWFFSMADATAYELIRLMTKALFDDNADALKNIWHPPEAQVPQT